MNATDKLYDVVAVKIGGKNTVRFMAEGKTLPNAEAIVKMAVMRRGVNDEFYCEVPAGLYKEGERWEGREKQNLDPSICQTVADELADSVERNSRG